MAQTLDGFTHSHVLHDDGSLSFACGSDLARWPWLALDPCDPIVVQTLNYYGAYEIAIARGEYRPGQWTALTQTDWRCGDDGAGHAVRGIAAARGEDSGAPYRVSFFDRDDKLVCEVSGKGVVFRNRDFAAWREAQKQDLGAPMALSDFPFVDAELIGRDSQIESYVSALDAGSPASVTALVTSENGFPPAHPYNDGSGDHVNAAHLADAALQFLRLAKGDPGLLVSGGDMRFASYVELGHPFFLKLAEPDEPGGDAPISIQQAGRECATIYLRPLDPPRDLSGGL